jgi:Flp pilus assembly protein TadG
MKQPWRRFLTDDEGASAVEFSIVGSIFVALCVAILQLGWALQIRNQIAHAADAAVRSTIIDPDASDSALKSTVYSILAEYDPERLHVETGETTVDAISFRTLTISYDVSLAIPFVPTKVAALSVTRRARTP